MRLSWRICYGSAAGKILNAGVYENFVFLLCLGFVHANRPISCIVSVLATALISIRAPRRRWTRVKITPVLTDERTGGKDMRGNSFLSRMLRRDADEDETRTHSAQEEIETKWSWMIEPEEGRQPRGLTLERAAEILDELPPDVPRESALRIVRRTLAAAGVEVGDFDKSTQAQEAKLNSKIELARNRQREVGEKTDEVIRSLEGRIRKAQENYEAIYVEEEREISRVSKKLENIKRTRAFFGLPEIEGEQNTGSSGEDTQVR